MASTSFVGNSLLIENQALGQSATLTCTPEVYIHYHMNVMYVPTYMYVHVYIAHGHNTEQEEVFLLFDHTHNPVFSTLSIRWYRTFCHLLNQSEPLKTQ